MQAVVLQPGGHVGLAPRVIAAPVADQVLVRVAGAGCNRADLLQRDGRYPAPPGAPADIPGLEFAGEVEAVGAGVLRLRAGDRIMGITGGGAQAEYLLVREELCVEVPASLDLLTAGAVPEAYFTAFEALVVQGGIRPGARVFVNAVASGVGTALVQLADAFGARVIGTTRSAAKLDRARTLGLHAGLVVDGSEPPGQLTEQIREAAGGEIDLAVDLLGGRHVSQAVDALRVGGRVVALGFLDDRAATIDVGALVSRRVSIVGTSLRSRPDHEKAALATRFSREVLPLVAGGQVSPVVDRVIDLADVAQAYDLLERNATFGKLVLRATAETNGAARRTGNGDRQYG
jgi:NADPH2:quinone reductase